MIPASVLLFAPDAPFFRGFAFQKVESESPKGCEVFGRVSSACSALVFAELNIQHPVELIFNAPMAADRTRKTCGITRETGKKVAPLGLNHPFDFTHGFNHADTL